MTPPLPPMLLRRPLGPLDRLALGQHACKVALRAVQWRLTNDPLDRWPRPALDTEETA